MKNLRLLRQPIYGSKTTFLPFKFSVHKTLSPSSHKPERQIIRSKFRARLPSKKIESKRHLIIHRKLLSNNNLFHTFVLVKICSSKPPYPLELTPQVFRYDNRPFM